LFTCNDIVPPEVFFEAINTQNLFSAGDPLTTLLQISPPHSPLTKPWRGLVLSVATFRPHNSGYVDEGSTALMLRLEADVNLAFVSL